MTSSSSSSSSSALAHTASGRIALIGAGPGDASLLTLGAKLELEAADLVLADELVDPGVLALARGRIIVADKHQRGQDPGQQTLNVAGLAALRRGERVVRLKSGDPFLYGRGGEELVFYRAHGFEARVLPGVTSAIAAPALANIPVTQRGVASQVLVLTAHGVKGALPDVPPFSATRTLVFLMCVKRLERITRELLVGERDYPQSTPAAVIESAGTDAQRVTVGTLDNIGALCSERGVVSPATLVVGAVVHAVDGPDAFTPMIADAANADVVSRAIAADDERHRARLVELREKKQRLVLKSLGADIDAASDNDSASSDDSDDDSSSVDSVVDDDDNGETRRELEALERMYTPSLACDDSCASMSTEAPIGASTAELDTDTDDDAELDDAEPLARAQFDDAHLAHINAFLESMPLRDVLRWCAITLPGLAQVSSFGPSGMVIMHALRELNIRVPTIFLDTLHHFDETLAHVDTSQKHFALDLHTYRCAFASSAAEFAAATGSDELWRVDEARYRDTVKVEPLERALRELRVSAWITGRRRDQSGVRGKLAIVERDDTDGRLKINPLALWSAEQVWKYVREHKLPYNPLHDQNYKSIGDRHSTRPVALGAPERSGRVFVYSARESNEAERTECGIHSNNPERERRRAEIAARRALSSRH